MAINKIKVAQNVQKLIQKGQFDKAIKEYQKILQDDPTDVRVILKIGDLFIRLNEVQDAIKYYRQVGDFYSKQGFYLKAIAIFKQILKYDPGQIELTQKLADLYHQLGLMSDALAQYQQAAAYFEQKGKIIESLEIYKRIIGLDPENIASKQRLADIYFKQGMTNDAVRELKDVNSLLKKYSRVEEYLRNSEKILQFTPEDSQLAKEMASIYFQNGDHKQALAKLQISFKADPKDVETLNLLADTFEAMNNSSKAVSVYRELLKLFETSGSMEDVIAVAQKIMKHSPDDKEATDAVTRAKRQAMSPKVPMPDRFSFGREKEAPSGATVISFRPDFEHHSEEDFDRTIIGSVGDYVPKGGTTPLPEEPAGQAKPSSQQPLSQPKPSADKAQASKDAISKLLTEANVYLKYGLKERAVEQLQKILSMDPSHVECHEKLRDVYMDAGNRTGAISEFMRIAEILKDQSETEKAAATLKELLEYEAGHSKAAAMLRELEGARGDDISLEIGPVPGGEAEAEPDVGVGEHQEAEEEIPIEVDEGYSLNDESTVALQEISGEADGRETLDLESEIEKMETTAGRKPFVEETTDVLRDSKPPFFASENMPLEEPGPSYDDSGNLAQSENFGMDDLGVDAGVDLGIDEEPQAGEEAEAHEAPEGTDDAAEAIEAELAEAIFFAEQGLNEEAEIIYDRIVNKARGNRNLTANLMELERLLGKLKPEEYAKPVEAEPAGNLEEEISREIEAIIAQSPEVDAKEESITGISGMFANLKEEPQEKKGGKHFELGNIYFNMGMINDAADEFDLALKESDEKDEALCQHMLGKCMVAKGMMTKGIGLFRQALNDPELPVEKASAVYFDMGEASEKLGDPEEAIYYYRRAKESGGDVRDISQRIEALKALMEEKRKKPPPAKQPPVVPVQPVVHKPPAEPEPEAEPEQIDEDVYRLIEEAESKEAAAVEKKEAAEPALFEQSADQSTDELNELLQAAAAEPEAAPALKAAEPPPLPKQPKKNEEEAEKSKLAVRKKDRISYI